jgi:hypothetical protein
MAAMQITVRRPTPLAEPRRTPSVGSTGCPPAEPTDGPARRVPGGAPPPPAAGVGRPGIVLLDLDVPPRTADDRPVGRRWILGGLLGAAGALALSGGIRGGRSILTRAPTLGGGWGSFAGPVPGSDLYLLVAVDTAGAAIAHACDGTATAVWFHGHCDGGALSAVSDGGAVPLGGRPGSAGTAGPVGSPPPRSFLARSSAPELVARVRPHRVEGTVTVDGVARSFALGPTAADGGLLAARSAVAGRTYAASWVLLGRGDQRGVLTVGRVAGPAPALGPHGVAMSDGVRLHPVRLDRFTRKWGRLSSEMVSGA